MQKFTTKEQEDFDAEQAKAHSEVEAKHAGDMAKMTKRLEAAVAVEKWAGDTERRKEMQKKLADYQRQMATTIATETRALLKEWFTYPIFLYEAQKVGITATGDTDQNELSPNPNQPLDVPKTCLEFYWEFRRDPKRFFINGMEK